MLINRFVISSVAVNGWWNFMFIRILAFVFLFLSNLFQFFFISLSCSLSLFFSCCTALWFMVTASRFKSSRIEVKWINANKKHRPYNVSQWQRVRAVCVVVKTLMFRIILSKLNLFEGDFFLHFNSLSCMVLLRKTSNNEKKNYISFMEM